MKTDGDRTKLPKWAQQEILRLERDLSHAKEKLAVGPEDSDTFANSYSDTPQPLGKGPSITFKYGPRWSDEFRARLEGDTLRIDGGSGLAVHPRATNLVEIKVVR